MSSWRIFCLFTLLFCSSLQAKSYILFTHVNGEEKPLPSSDYEEVLPLLRPGDEVVFSNGQRYQLGHFLGNGNTTMIFDIGNQKAIRLPYSKKRIFTLAQTRDFLKSYYDGYESLASRGLPIPKVFKNESLAREYLIVERIDDIYFDLSDLSFLRPKFLAALDESPHLLQKVLQDLRSFMKKAAQFSAIGDFGGNQLVYTAKGWVLLDWDKGGRKKNQLSQMLSKIFGVFPGHYNTLREAENKAKEMAKIKQLIQQYDVKKLRAILQNTNSPLTVTSVIFFGKSSPEGEKLLQLFLDVIIHERKIPFAIGPAIELIFDSYPQQIVPIFEDLIKTDRSLYNSLLIEHFYSRPISIHRTKELHLLFERTHFYDLLKFVQHIFTKEHSVIWTDLLQQIALKADFTTRMAILRQVFTLEHAQNWEDIFISLIYKDPALFRDHHWREIATTILSQDHAKDWQKAFVAFDDLTGGAYRSLLTEAPFTTRHPEIWQEVQARPFLPALVQDKKCLPHIFSKSAL